MTSSPSSHRAWRLHRGFAFALLMTLAAPSAQAQTGSWSDQFDRPGLLGSVFAVNEFGGEIVAGGVTTQADGVELGLVARWDGQHWSTFGSGIHGFIVRDFAIYQGELVAAGQFDVAGGQSIHSIARWNGAQWQPLGGGLALSFGSPATVFALEVYQNELYATGQFDRADNNVVVSNIARWNGTQWSSVGTGIDGDGYALKAGADGKLYAGGLFLNAGNVAANSIAAWDGTSWSQVGSGSGGGFVGGTVRALEWHASKLWAGGYFDIPGGAVQEKLASLNGSTWQAEGNLPDSSNGLSVYALQSLGADLYVGGNIVSVDGIAIDRIARKTGTQWSSIGGVRGASTATVVLALGVHGGDLIVGGNFSNAATSFLPGGPIVSNSIASFDGTSWGQIGKGLGFNASLSGAMRWNGGGVAVGSFTEAGHSTAHELAYFDGNDWQRLAELDGPGYDLCTFQNELIVTGNFTTVDGQPFSGVAAFNGTTWHGFGNGGFPGYGVGAVAVYHNELYAGSIGGVKRWNGNAWVSFAPQIFGSVGTLHVHNDVLYIAGVFTVMGGNIASWDGTTQQIVGGGMNNAVDALTSFNGELIAGGIFTQAGGSPANRIARWNGSSWSAFANISGSGVTAMTVFGGELYASGNPLFAAPSIGYIGRWDGAQWQPLGAGPNGTAAELVPDDAAGKLYVAGTFQHADGKPSWHFAVWDVGASALTFCAGDGSASVCPCGNASPAGSGAGCLNSSGSGGRVSAGGSARLSGDSLTLHGSGMTNSSALYFQGTTQTAGGAGSVFGDGLRCAGGSIARLGAEVNVGGMSQYPTGGDAAISVKGAVGSVGTRTYQVWYRNAAAYCTASTFNLTNGCLVNWVP